MPVAALSFGSLGDITEVVHILYELKEAVIDGVGAYTEYQEAMESLDRFISGLETLGHLQARTNSMSNTGDVAALTGQRIPSPESLAIEQINKSLEATKRIAADFQVRLRRYDARWVLSSPRKDLDAMRSKLSYENGIIHSAMSGLLTHILLTGLMALDTTIKDTLSRVPRSPGEVSFLILIDMMNERRHVPMYLCGTREEFHGFLLFVFRQTACLTFIQRHDYDLDREGHMNENITVAAWEELARPNVTVTMAAIMRMYEGALERGCCPQCRKPSLSGGSTAKCQYCTTSWSEVTFPEDEVVKEGNAVLGCDRYEEVQFLKRIKTIWVRARRALSSSHLGSDDNPPAASHQDYEEERHQASVPSGISAMLAGSKPSAGSEGLRAPGELGQPGGSGGSGGLKEVGGMRLGRNPHSEGLGRFEHTIKLNDLLQRSYGARALTWETFYYGPAHSSHMVAVAYINGVEYGRGSAWTLHVAREQAAGLAYHALYNQIYNGIP
ncbi:hypothetical protein NM688_g6966 [Phlebia brevispora]|uniref:Uncharacterized protein n=1 Tax=Phlebia brevispora TaxID=194682 RepID=A0ACC1SAH6_9APHY|nr:hypothetical protein NM688_g6966 [Phlebia brevispora]